MGFTNDMRNSIDYLNTFDITTFFDNSKSIICFKTDLEGNVLFENAAYRAILNYGEKNIESQIINPNLETLVNIDDIDIIFEGILTLRRDRANSSFDSKVCRRGNTLIFICEYNSTEIEMLYNQMTSNNLQINNMNRELIKTQFSLKNTIKELKDTQAKLIHSEKMNALGQLVAGVAHEINNPMAYVTSNIQIMEEYVITISNFLEALNNENMIDVDKLKKEFDIDYILSDILKLHEATFSGAKRVNEIVAQLRDFSKIDAIELNVCNIKECVDIALSIANTGIVEKGIKLVLNIEESPEIECYPAQLNQAFLNLIINAIQAIEKDGLITISLYEEEENVVFKIEDNGCGISSKDIDLIYDAFFTTKEAGKGVGLGLNMVYKSIKDLHQGEIKVESSLNEGTSFTVYIPKNIQR